MPIQMPLSCADTMVFCQERKLQDALETLMDITLLDRHRLSQEQTYCLLCKGIFTLCLTPALCIQQHHGPKIFI